MQGNNWMCCALQACLHFYFNHNCLLNKATLHLNFHSCVHIISILGFMPGWPTLVWIDTPTQGIKSYIIIILHKQTQTEPRFTEFPINTSSFISQRLTLIMFALGGEQCDSILHGVFFFPSPVAQYSHRTYLQSFS